MVSFLLHFKYQPRITQCTQPIHCQVNHCLVLSSSSVQPTSNVQPHHLTFAPPLSQLVPPTAPLSSYRRVEGPSFPDLTREDESQYLMLKMALSNLLDPGESEKYKYHILLDHLKVDQARRLALAYVYAPDPYTQAIRALDERYGQPRQLALKELRAIMEMPAIRIGDGRGLDQFSLRVQALVGLLQTMGSEGLAELTCGSHVERLLEKLPHEQFCQFKRCMSSNRSGPLSYNLLDFSNWLQQEARCQPRRERTPQPVRQKPPLPHPLRNTTILHGSKTASHVTSSKAQVVPIIVSQSLPNTLSERCPVCAYCNSAEHHVSKCDDFLQLTKDQRINWIKEQ
ncbi:guanine nucleotide-binding subunit alpha-12 isoform X2 [Labeo rohita]|uniref:Guanine nucleotide-binding subunit alpha-12 isoform X2 n=1 Tax=Labeo rohita TaxID=84645 RepID=A0A498NTN8_LABRO|nr:guanine nucleotide-binding subunit alpha-12 isoform X2 [Labeo rohita]